MRTHKTDGKGILFIRDTSTGGWVMCCPCSEDVEIVSNETTNDVALFCKQCKSELCYRPWCEW